MIFTYPDKPLVRKHGPRGYKNYQAFKPWLRDEFAFRCAYCLLRESWEPHGADAFSVDHYLPRVSSPSRIGEYDNLLYVCTRCNSAKREQLHLLDPFEHAFAEHLMVHENGSIGGLNPEGRKLIRQLRLDHPRLTEFRRDLLKVVRILAASSALEATQALRTYLGFPRDLPDLRKLRPPGSNSRPEGIGECYFARRERGLLPAHY